MKRDDDPPHVIDLHRYRQAAERRRAKPPPRPQASRRRGGEPLLGSRPRAGLFLALALLAVLAVSFGPALLGR